MHEGNLQRLIFLLSRSFDSLGVKVPLVKIEDLAVLIFKGMTVQARNYHNLDHVFSLTDEQSPIITLSALFHDLVYCQVDLGFLPEIRRIIDPFIYESNGQITIKGEQNLDDRHFLVLLGIFDFSPGQIVAPKKGLNEFLSALVMVKELENLVSDGQLFHLILCVEATIPFRPSTASGTDYFYYLEEKAAHVNEKLGFEFKQEFINEGVLNAVKFANKDVESFGEPNVSNYLETTWKLIPELNANLRAIETYSIREYRQALQAMQISMDKLDPYTIFHQYRGQPADDIYEQMLDRATMNIKTGQDYLHIKLLTQAILEALAELSGGDAPLSLFMGDILSDGSHHRRIEDFLPEVPLPTWVNPSSDLYHLLSCPFDTYATFDLCTAPLSLFVHKLLSPSSFAQGLSLAHEMFAGRLSPAEFLENMDPTVISPIAKASSEMVITRCELLQKFVLNT